MSASLTIAHTDLLHQLKLQLGIPDLVTGLKKQHILQKTAKKYEIEIKPEALQVRADRLRQDYSLLTAEATWAWLQSQGLSLETFEAVVSSQLLEEQVKQYLFAPIIEETFAKTYGRYAKAIIYEIQVDDEDLARELFYMLQEQEASFFELAHQYHRDLEGRRCCGYRGALSRSQLPPGSAVAVFAAQAPQALPPIVLGASFHLLWVDEILSPQLTETVRAEILEQLYQDWLTQELSELMVTMVLGEYEGPEE
jgi:hypothetical protein